jgi:hypothetical protein
MTRFQRGWFSVDCRAEFAVLNIDKTDMESARGQGFVRAGLHRETQRAVIVPTHGKTRFQTLIPAVLDQRKRAVSREDVNVQLFRQSAGVVQAPNPAAESFRPARARGCFRSPAAS